MNIESEFDVVLWGATGYVGCLVAEYLLKQYGLNGELKWAIAGRSKSKLEQVQANLGNNNIPLIVADSFNSGSLLQMVKRTRVICSTVGPYALYGSELVKACVEQGTDYCDLTAEVQWMRSMIDQYHETAQKSGSRIVHCCGFDAIPSDMGTYFLQREAKQKKGEYCDHIKMRVGIFKGGFSGGTIASINNILLEASKKPSVFELLNNPYALNPIGEQSGVDENDLQSVIFDEDLGVWIMPFLMAPMNTRIVRRSHALNNYPYGKTFRYDESMICGRGIFGRIKGYIGLLMLGIMMFGKPGSVYKKFMSMLLPKPGEGPTAKQREAGFYNFTVIGKFKNGEKIMAAISGDLDPGYGSTSRMLAECAVCLALDKDVTKSVAGVITPSVAMGDALLKRLQENAELSFSIVD